MSAAVEEELQEVRARRSGRRIRVASGHEAGRTDQDVLYRFGLDQPADVPDEVPAELEVGEDVYQVQTVSSTPFELVLSSPVGIKADLGAGHVRLDPAFLLEKLLERLTDLQEDDCELAMALFGSRSPREYPVGGCADDDGANEYQLAAAQAALARDVTYVWGPPGTGKTTALAVIGQALAQCGLRVLLAASTNIAVDNAAYRLATRLDSGTVVRLGTPQLPELRRPPADLRLDAVRVVSAKRQRDPDRERARVRELRQARVLATTLAACYLCPEIGWFDAVVIDEASAAALPAVFCAAALASTRVVVLGDPKQLPPVAESRGPAAARWLKRDVFQEAELEDDDDRSVLLREQYRMPPAVSRLANELVYGGRLIDAAPRSSAGSVRLVDTSALGGRCERGPSGSRLNHTHAEVVAQLVESLSAVPEGPPPADQFIDEALHALAEPGVSTDAVHAILDRLAVQFRRSRLAGFQAIRGLQERAAARRLLGSDVAQALEQLELRSRYVRPMAAADKSMAVITPYTAQRRLIWQTLRDARLDHLADVGTVHRFQGLERDTIIFDTVEASPERPAPFLREGYGSEAMRLINVAITRAKSNLVVVADVDWLGRTLPRLSTLRGLLWMLREDED